MQHPFFFEDKENFFSKKDGVLLSQFFNYLFYEKNYSLHTVRAYWRDIRLLVFFLKDHKTYSEMSNLDVFQVRSYVSYLVEKGKSPRTCSRFLSSLRALFSFGVRNHLLPELDVDVSLPRPSKRLPQFLDENEIEFFFSQLPRSTWQEKRNLAIFELLYSSGLRVSELIQLKWSDIDLWSMTIRVLGKGKKERILPFGHPVVVALKDYQESLKKQFVDFQKFVFLNRFQKPLTARSIQLLTHKWGQRLLNGKTVYPHLFRHSFATHLLNAGADLKSTQELLGHEHLKTTEIYTHVTWKRMQEAYRSSHPRSSF